MSVPFPWGFWEGSGPPNRKAISDQVIKYLRTFKARPIVGNPPELSFLHILVPPRSLPLPPPYMGLDSGRISSTDKNLVALYAGGYLIYDASNDSLSVIPRLPDDDDALHGVMGHQSAVVMCDAQGEGYLLAELVMPGFSQAGVWLWKSSCQDSPRPGHPLPSSRFSVDLCFSYRGSLLCCDLNQDCNNKFSFINLPQECPAYDINPEYPDIVRPDEFRSMACVCAAHIKLMALDECGLELIVWTLSPDLSGWTVTCKYNVEKIWANVSYQSAGLRQLAPSLPVLSIHQDGVVYLVVNDESIVDRRLVHKGQYLLRVDMENDEVHVSPQPTRRICSQLFASEFSAHRHTAFTASHPGI
ncbi:hypothetical protein VPH35_017943 [Triticum aestivum]